MMIFFHANDNHTLYFQQTFIFKIAKEIRCI